MYDLRGMNAVSIRMTNREVIDEDAGAFDAFECNCSI